MSGSDPWLQRTRAWFASMVLLEPSRSKETLCIYTMTLLWSGLHAEWLLTDFSGKRSCPGLRHPPTRGWTNPSHLVSGWDVCREISYYNGQLWVPIYLRNISMSSWRGSECSEGLTSSESVVSRLHLVHWMSSLVRGGVLFGFCLGCFCCFLFW